MTATPDNTPPLPPTPPTPRSRWPRRRTALIIAALAFIGLVISSSQMARRVSRHHQTTERELYVFNPVMERQFTYAGRPVTIEDEENPRRIIVTYGPPHDVLPDAPPTPPDIARLEIIPTLPSLAADLPGLARHESWLKVLRFAGRRGMSLDELRRRIETGEAPDRLVLVTRHPPLGAETDSVEQAARSQWMFTFHEFLPDGTFETTRLRYPESERSFRRRQRAAPEGETIQRRPDELQEGTWQFYAALMVMPPATAPSPRFVGDAVSSMGWTLPATSISILILLVSLAFAMAPTREDVARRGA
jgi:hypothetical protein